MLLPGRAVSILVWTAALASSTVSAGKLSGRTSFLRPASSESGTQEIKSHFKVYTPAYCESGRHGSTSMVPALRAGGQGCTCIEPGQGSEKGPSACPTGGAHTTPMCVSSSQSTEHGVEHSAKCAFQDCTDGGCGKFYYSATTEPSSSCPEAKAMFATSGKCECFDSQTAKLYGLAHKCSNPATGNGFGSCTTMHRRDAATGSRLARTSMCEVTCHNGYENVDGLCCPHTFHNSNGMCCPPRYSASSAAGGPSVCCQDGFTASAPPGSEHDPICCPAGSVANRRRQCEGRGTDNITPGKLGGSRWGDCPTGFKACATTSNDYECVALFETCW